MSIPRAWTIAALALVACIAAGAGVVLSHHRSEDARIPTHRPAADAAGAAGWVWPDGVPGWKPGETIHGFPVSGLQPVEVAAAQLAAARAILDAERVRVVTSLRPGRHGVLAILAAPTLYETPEKTCLAALLPGSEPVVWRCPGPHQLSHRHVLVAAVLLERSAGVRVPGGSHALYLVGVARGDVDRIALVGTGNDLPTALYERGVTWGEFETAVAITGRAPRLLVYGRRGRLVETVRLDLAPGQQRVFR